jgi:DNA-binding beta-propeller fold protein YncE
VLRLVRLIPVVLLLALRPMSPALAQSESAAETPEARALPANDLGALYYLGSFSSAQDLPTPSGICGAFGLVGGQPVPLPEVIRRSTASPSRCDVVVDAVAGSREYSADERLSQPYKVTSDSKDRVMVADRGGYPSIHIFDFARRRHSRIAGGPGKRLQSPAGLAVDGQDQLYVTDAQLGAILVYYPNGKFRRYIGNRKGERLFERPGGIAVDRASGHIYVADPPRNMVVMLDADGNILAKIGSGADGSGPGEFAAPTDVVVRDQELFVLDSQNYRIQVLDLAGRFRASIHPESMGPSLGFSIDSEGRIYLDGPLDTVRVFRRDGRLLLRFGETGAGYGQFNLPSGIWIDSSDRIYVADTRNHRVQSLEWGAKHETKLPHPY